LTQAAELSDSTASGDLADPPLISKELKGIRQKTVIATQPSSTSGPRQSRTI
jgi:hypothetical protein